MRKLLICLALATAAVLPAPSASAYDEGPWCLRANMGRNVTERCPYNSFEACNAERTNWGTTAFCGQNPRYLPYWQGRGFDAEPARKMTHKKKYRRQAASVH